MKELREYLNLLKDLNPSYIYDWFLAIFCIGVVILLICKRKKAGRYIAILILSEYTFLLYCTTVIFRVVRDSNRYALKPFWSYNKPDLFLENIMNIVAFVPIGLLLGVIFRQIKWWNVMLIGGCISISIEILQLITKRGFSEIDDVIHNELGCVVGFLIACCFSKKEKTL